MFSGRIIYLLGITGMSVFPGFSIKANTLNSSDSGTTFTPAATSPCSGSMLASNMLLFEDRTLNGTGASGAPDPGCGRYSGREDWFKVVVPPSGSLSIETKALTLTDISMAVYKGPCSQPALMQCISESECKTSAMPAWFFENLIPGDTLLLRFWDDGGQLGTFSIKVSNPYGNPYIRSGNANPIQFDGRSNCIEMTSDNYNQRGCAWYPVRTDFSKPFTYDYTVYLGRRNEGADGMCIVFQPNSPNECGVAGGGIGAQGIRNSWIIEMDTWQNGEYGDPSGDHIGIGINGFMNHRGHPPVTVPNLEDNRFHTIKLSWEPVSQQFSVFLDGSFVLTVTYDIVGRIFQNNPLAYWGITASTGGERNQHVLCFENVNVENRVPESREVHHALCKGDSILIAGTYRTRAGVISDSLINKAGCDSIVVHTITELPLDTVYRDTSICQGRQWLGRDTEGVYEDRFTAISGCDSTTVTRLYILPVFATDEYQTSCDSFLWSATGQWLKQSGRFTAQLATQKGCDSTATLHLTIPPPSRFTVEEVMCDSFYWQQTRLWYTHAGRYSDTLSTIVGCDSVVTLDLTIHRSVAETRRLSACGSFTWNETGKTYTKSGLYESRYTTSKGCDSLVWLNLDVFPEYSSDTTIQQCDQFTWSVNQQTYTESGRYQARFTSQYGCDSLYYVSLLISPSYRKEEQKSVCDSLNWTVNNASLMQSGLYSASYTSAQGCDSIHTLQLDIHPSYNLSVTSRACEEYIWEETSEIYTTSGIYKKPLTSSMGCDSVRQLYLTIDTGYSFTDTILARESYFWPVTKETYSREGVYSASFLSIQGCDSLQFIDLRLLRVTYPNIISINGDGANEVFTIYGTSLVESISELSIFDRWGNRVFHGRDMTPGRNEEGWNGTYNGHKAVPGVYTFIALLRLTGFPPEFIKGTITIIR